MRDILAAAQYGTNGAILDLAFNDATKKPIILRAAPVILKS